MDYLLQLSVEVCGAFGHINNFIQMKLNYVECFVVLLNSLVESSSILTSGSFFLIRMLIKGSCEPIKTTTTVIPSEYITKNMTGKWSSHLSHWARTRPTQVTTMLQ